MNKLILGDCFEVMKTLPENSIDSIVCDPPYELGFMGKKWDNSGIAYNVDMWAECLRVLKPGGHLLSFSGTRTYHRMAVAIEDAGFEVRDMIEWCYGSGFPKSQNIALMIDKKSGLQGQRGVGGFNVGGKGEQDNRTAKLHIGSTTDGSKQKAYTEYKSEESKQFGGWGTALKPAHESIMLAQKPLTSVPLFDKIDIDLIIKKILCLLVSNVKIAESNLVLSQHGLSEELNIAQWIAEENTNTQDALSVLTDMLLSESKENTNLNIVILWLNILEDLYQLQNKFTTLTEISLTIELKILESLEWENIFQNITQAKDKTTDGKNVNVLTAVNLFNAVRLKLNHILTHFAQDPAILKDEYSDIRPKHEPICMARKPLAEKTVAENCLKWGTGGINIDESRVGTEGARNNGNSQGTIGSNSIGVYGKAIKQDYNMGRFPANLIHDNSEEVRECFPETKARGNITEKDHGGKYNATSYEFGGKESGWGGDSGNASRFFRAIPNDVVDYNDFLIYNRSILTNIKQLCGQHLTKKRTDIILDGVIQEAEKFIQDAELLIFGNSKMEKFLTDTASTIKTLTAQMTELKTLNVLPNWLIMKFTEDYEKTIKLLKELNTEDVKNAESINHLIVFKREMLELIRGIAKIVVMENSENGKSQTEKKSMHTQENGNGLTNEKDSFFKSIIYQAKASKSEKNKGCEGLEAKQYSHDGRDKEIENAFQRNKSIATNNHPTVKPIALMEYLIKMITPKGGIVLDPFAGSGSTLVAAKENGFNFVGIELTEEYIPIIEARTGVKAERVELDPQNIVADLIEKDLPIPPKQGGNICECGGKFKKAEGGMICEECFKSL